MIEKGQAGGVDGLKQPMQPMQPMQRKVSDVAPCGVVVQHHLALEDQMAGETTTSKYKGGLG